MPRPGSCCWDNFPAASWIQPGMSLYSWKTSSLSLGSARVAFHLLFCSVGYWEGISQSLQRPSPPPEPLDHWEQPLDVGAGWEQWIQQQDLLQVFSLQVFSLCIPRMDQTPDKTGKVMPAPTSASGKQFQPASAAGNLGWGGRDPGHLQGGILHIPPMEFPKGHHRGIQGPLPGGKSSIHGSFGLELNSWC